MSDKPRLSIKDLDSLFVIPEFDSAQIEQQMAQAYERCQANPNAFSNWFPAVEKLGLAHPKTITVRLSHELQSQIIDNKSLTETTQVEVDDLVKSIQDFGKQYSFPLFIKTAFSSAKHYWKEACSLPDASQETVLSHLAELLNFQCMNGIETFTPELVIREMLHVEPVFTAFMGEMPVTEEFRVFARDGKFEGYQPYWPEDSIQDPSITDWRAALETISNPTSKDLDLMIHASERVTRLLKGYWSVDFLKDKDGKLWLIDMAEGDRSYKNVADFRVIKHRDNEPSP